MAIRALQETEDRAPLRFTPIEGRQEAAQPQKDEQPVLPRPKPEKPVREARVVQFPTAETVAVLSLLMKAVGTRVLLLLAGIGAFVLAMVALEHNTIQSIITSALYDALVFAPCIYLALRREA